MARRKNQNKVATETQSHDSVRVIAVAERKGTEAEGRCGVFGDLGRDGYRVTRWDRVDDEEGWHGLDGSSMVMCLNLAGRSAVRAGTASGELGPGELGLAFANGGKVAVGRIGEGRHRFVVLEMRRAWVGRWLPPGVEAVRRTARGFLSGAARGKAGCETGVMAPVLSEVARQLFEPPGSPAGWASWHYAKALEAASHGLFPTEEEEFFCHRTKRAAVDRVERVKGLLTGNLEYPLSLAELGKAVGCSPFYLSRVFREETGQTISQFLRARRLERAAELLRQGEANVTEAAMAVGYSSLSHFSKAFAEVFGCCPCFYGRRGADA